MGKPPKKSHQKGQPPPEVPDVPVGDAPVKRKRGRPRKVVPPDLGRLIRGADSVEKLEAVGTVVGGMIVDRLLEGKTGELALSWVKEQRQLVKARRAEKAEKAVMAIEVLTPEEEVVLKKFREELAGPALLPGQAVPPPIIPGQAE